MTFKSGDIVKWQGKRTNKHAEFMCLVNHKFGYDGYQKAIIHVFGNKKSSIVFVDDLEMIEEKRN